MRRTVAALVGLLSSPVALAQGSTAPPKAGDMVENPPYAHWVQFKAGASATVKDRVTMGDGSIIESTITSKLVTKSKEGVKVETIVTSGVGGVGVKGLERSTTSTWFPAMVKYDVTQNSPSAGYTVTEGKEIVDVKGKKVETEWVEATSTNGDESSVEKVWTAKEIPGGVVKRTMTKKKGTGSVSTETSVLAYQGKMEQEPKK